LPQRLAERLRPLKRPLVPLSVRLQDRQADQFLLLLGLHARELEDPFRLLPDDARPLRRVDPLSDPPVARVVKVQIADRLLVVGRRVLAGEADLRAVEVQASAVVAAVAVAVDSVDVRVAHPSERVAAALKAEAVLRSGVRAGVAGASKSSSRRN